MSDNMKVAFYPLKSNGEGSQGEGCVSGRLIAIASCYAAAAKRVFLRH